MELDIELLKLFELQDRALAHNFQQSIWAQRASTILARSIQLNLSILGSMQFPAEKKTAIRCFSVDTLSHIVIAARLGLWGALPESLSVLRGGIESCAQLFYAVEAQRYQTAILEGNKKFKQLDFQKVCSELGGLGRSLKRDHNQISNQGSHSTAARFGQTEYHSGGDVYDRLGFATNPPSAEEALCRCILPSLMVGDSFECAYLQDGLPFKWKENLGEVANVYSKFIEEFPRSKKKRADETRESAEAKPE